MNKFSVFPGEFKCQKCDLSVDKLRLWKDTLDLTWFCEKKHTSKVSLNIKGY